MKFHLYIDGKDTELVIDYSKVNLYDEVELEIERKAGSTLGKYILSAEKVNTGNGGSGSGSGSNGGSGSGSENNPSTGAADMIGVASAMAVVSLAAAAAVSLKKRK